MILPVSKDTISRDHTFALGYTTCGLNKAMIVKTMAIMFLLTMISMIMIDHLLACNCLRESIHLQIQRFVPLEA